MHEESAVAGIGNVGAGLTTLDSRGDAKRRTLLVVTSRDVVSETLALAIEAEFPWIAMEQVESVEAACISFARPVSLILIDAFLLDAAEASATELTRFHPEAHAAVIEANGQRLHAPIVEILRSRLVGGVLPMNLPLDVWLSIVRLMLRGGKYFPADMLYPGIRPGPGDIPRKAGSGDWTEPSRRELEILELVSRGLQNKSIAARLNLSEHTVKIHLHNIISKLRVHNRTEAAAWFRDHGHEVLPKASCETR